MGIICGVRMRISYYVQLVAFGLALMVPLLAVLIGIGLQVDVLYCTVYAWLVGILAALWNRKTVVE